MWRAWRMKSNYLWLFAVAWAMPIAFAGARLANSFDLVAWHFWIDNSTIASMAIEAMLSSVAIAYRIRLLSRERDTAIRPEVAARALDRKSVGKGKRGAGRVDHGGRRTIKKKKCA